jgi:hypothetical protein
MKRMIKKSVKRTLVFIILVGVGLPVIIVAAKNLFSFSANQVNVFFSPEECSVTLKTFYSALLAQDIKNYIALRTTKQSLLKLNPSQLLAELQDTFPVVKKASYRFVPPKMIAFQLEGTEPLCIVNNRHVLGNQASLLNCDNFDEETLVNLPKITIQEDLIEDLIAPKQLRRFLNTLTPYHWDNFTISYHNPWHIELIPKKAICHAKIIASEQSIFDTKKFAALAPIFKDLCCRKIITERVLNAKNYPLVFDTRITQHIIVKCNYPAKRGGGHG